MSPPLEKEGFVLKYCRMCAVQLKQGVFIFGDEGKRLQIPEKIRKTLAILVLEEDTLPKKICTDCCSSLEDYSQYKDTVLDAQEKLSAIAKNLERSMFEKAQELLAPSRQHQTQTSILQLALTSATKEHADLITTNTVEDSDSNYNIVDNNSCGEDIQEEMAVKTTSSPKKEPSPKKSKPSVSSSSPDKMMTRSSLSPSKSFSLANKAVLNNSTDKDESPPPQKCTDPDEWVLQCGICSLPTEGRLDLKNHHEKNHSSDQYPQPVYGCSFCPRIGENYNALRMHIYRHLKEGAFKCDHCGRTFPLKNQLDQHSAHFAANDGKNYNCKVCGKQKFTAKCSLASHMKEKHNSLEGKKDDDDVERQDKSGDDEEDAAEPLSPSHGDDASTPLPMEVEYNDDQVLLPQVLPHNSRTSPRSPPDNVTLVVVVEPESQPNSKEGDTAPTLLVDEQLDRGVWKCEVCNKQYQTSRGLELHAVIHTQKRFECEHCDKKFTQKASLMHHLTSQHSDAPRLFKCDICSKEFITSKHLRRHKRFHSEPDAESPCLECGKVFKTRLRLLSHMKIHASKLNFPCDKCEKRFPNKAKLSIHENSHTGARTFQCPHCSYAGRTPGPFYRHLKTHEKKAKKETASATTTTICKVPSTAITTSTSTSTTTISVPHPAPPPSSSSTPILFPTTTICGTTPIAKLDTESITLNFSSPILEDLSNKNNNASKQYHIVSVPRTPTSLVSISHSHPSPQQHSSNGIIVTTSSHHPIPVEYHSQSQQQNNNDQVISHAHASSSSHHSSSQNYWANSQSYPTNNSSTKTTTFELVDCAFPCDNNMSSSSTSTSHSSQQQLPPPPSYQYAAHNNYSPPNQQHAHTTAILHTSPSSAHSSVPISFISASSSTSSQNVTTIFTGGNHAQQQNEPMELSYKLHLDNGQDVPMELTKVFQRDPLELCVRTDFNQLMDLSSRVGGDGGMNIPLNMNNNNNNNTIIGLGNGYHKDMTDRELCFNDLSGAFRQPIDLIARQDDPSDICSSEGSLVDLSLRSSFVQDQSTFLRELIDLSARSESFHGELNLTNKSGTSTQHHQQSHPHNNHSHHQLQQHHTPSGKGHPNSMHQQQQQGTLTAVIYQDAMFSL